MSDIDNARIAEEAALTAGLTAGKAFRAPQVAATIKAAFLPLFNYLAAANFAPTSSPQFTGAPKAPTQGAADNSANLATTAYADRAAALVAGSGGTGGGAGLSGTSLAAILRAVEADVAGSVATLINSLPPESGNPTNIHWNSGIRVVAPTAGSESTTGYVYQFVQSTLGYSSAKMAAIISAAGAYLVEDGTSGSGGGGGGGGGSSSPPVAVNDTNRTGAATDSFVEWTALSAPRNYFMPAASSRTAGSAITLADTSGNCSDANTITPVLNGTDTFVGQTSPFLATPGGRLRLVAGSNGKWLAE